MTTKTLAEIYLQQGHLQQAYEIYKALAEKDPSDMEVKKRLEELEEKLHPSPLSREEKIRHLEKWLTNIRRRRPT
ncbi:MAG TPA: tetratricopeptide repeat protein [Thermodesulfobacteriota bacterium]|nr:tetratricopeptide repeat protein [Thermodesulfobacteriota bacterium]